MLIPPESVWKIPGQIWNQIIDMAYDNKPVILKWEQNPNALDSGESSFENMLDTTCERLWEKHIQYSIRRIQEMDEELERLEKELDEFIGQPARGTG